MRNSARAFMQKIEDAWGVILQRGIPGWAISGQVAGGTLPPAGAGVPYAATHHTHPLSDLEQSSAADGDVVTWSDGDGAWIAAPGGGGGGGSLTVTDGVTTVTSVNQITLTGATVTDLTGGEAGVAITGGGGIPSGDQVRTVLYENTLGGSGTWDVSGISGSYDDLEIEIFGRDTNGATLGGVQIYLNNDTTVGNYAGARWYYTLALNTNGSSEDVEIGFIDGGSTNSNSFSRVSVRIPAYAGGTWKTVAADSYAPTLGAIAKHTTAWHNTAAVTRVAFTTRGTNFAAGSKIRIIGVKTQP